MVMSKSFRSAGIGAGLVLVIAGCGGGSGSSAGTSAGTSGTVSAGAIAAFGSIVVNGVHYEVDDAEIEQDGDRLGEDDLELGMRVVVRDDDDDDRAEHVELEEAVRGPVDSVDEASGSMTVMGQTVLVDAGTRFDDPVGGLADLAQGDVVEVMGLRNADGHVEAEYIERKAGGTRPYTVTGRIRNLDADAFRFEIDGLVVDYQNARIDDDSYDDYRGSLREGGRVEVKDDNRTYAPGSATLAATRVEREEEARTYGDGRWIEIERIVTAVNGDGTFVVGGELTVDPGAAEFRRGTAGDIVVGVRVEIEGVLGSDGVLAAREIEFEDREVDIEAPVQAVDTDAGTIELLGIVVKTDAWTEFDDFSGLGDLVAGDFVEVEGHAVPGGGIVAREIEREEDDDRIELKGPVSAFDADAGTLTLLGRTVVTDGATVYDDTTRSGFFGNLVPHASVVELEWSVAGFGDLGTTPVEKAELEEDDDDDRDDVGDDDSDDDDDDADDDGSDDDSGSDD